MNIVVSWICVFCVSILCANCLRSLYILFFYEKSPKKIRTTSHDLHSNVSTSHVRQPSYRTSSSNVYVSGAVAIKEDISYNSYEQYRKNHKIAR